MVQACLIGKTIGSPNPVKEYAFKYPHSDQANRGGEGGTLPAGFPATATGSQPLLVWA